MALRAPKKPPKVSEMTTKIMGDFMIRETLDGATGEDLSEWMWNKAGMKLGSKSGEEIWVNKRSSEGDLSYDESKQGGMLKNNLRPVHVFTCLETQHSYALSLRNTVMDSLFKYK